MVLSLAPAAKLIARAEYGLMTAPEFREAVANARLIAAAPELLLAVKAALNDRRYLDWPVIAELLIAAIAKAEGAQ